MIDSNIITLFKLRYKALSVNGQGDNYSGLTGSLTLGLVVNTDDPLEGGRLQVFCPALNDNPKKVMHLPWAAYISPFGGSINNKNFARGTGDGESGSDGAVHYGFWAVPELGSHVLVGCIDGDPRRRFFVGSLPEHQETHTQFNGRFDWAGDGTPDGPLTSSKKPIQPIYDNWTQAFVDRTSREWKTRGADYQVSVNSKDGNGSPSTLRGDDYLDETFEGMSAHEKDDWVKEVMGANGYDWSGFKSVGPFKSSRVYGMSTPGFHSFSMDDRPFNSRVKLRTATGHMILMDDTNERIYVMTNKGKNWVEMDSNGNIDVFSENRVSIASAGDINLTTQGTLRMHAAESIHMYAGHIVNEPDSTEGLLTEPPIKGEIRIQAETDMHLVSTNQRTLTHENSYREVGMNCFKTVGDSSISTVTNDISVSTVSGDHILTSGNNIHATSTNDTKHFAKGKTSVASELDAEMQSFSGRIAVSSSQEAKIKSMNSNVDMQAGAVSGAGDIKMFTPQSQQIIGEGGIQSSTSGPINHTSGTEITAAAAPGYTIDSTGPTGTVNVSKITTTNIQINAALGDIMHKTAMVSHSYDALTTHVKKLTTGLNTLTYQVGTITTAITDAVSTLSGDISDVIDKFSDLGSLLSVSVDFDFPCLTGNLFGGLPTELTDLFATLEELNDALVAVGELPTTLEHMADVLADSAVLALLGLSPSFSMGIDFGISPCISGLPTFGGAITAPSIVPKISQNLRALINSIYQAGSPQGTAPPLTPLDDAKPSPLTITPPVTGPV